MTSVGDRLDRLAAASARVPFRLKVALVWVAIFAVLAGIFVAAEYDIDWMRDNLCFIAQGLRYTLYIAVGGIALAIVLALLGALSRISSQPDCVRDRRLLRVVLPRHAADRTDVPHLPGLPQVGINLHDRFPGCFPQSFDQLACAGCRGRRRLSRWGSTTAPT